MKVTFWGTRGSIPTAGPNYVKYGGNTPCIQVGFDSTKDIIVCDSGTGIRELGLRLVQTARDHSRVIHLFLTHGHWDHIQGFPFFIPAFLPDFTINIYCTKDAKSILDGQMREPYFPVTMDVMGSKRIFHQINSSTPVHIAGGTVRNIPLPHPQGSTGFRFEENGKAFVFATDTEHLPNGLNTHLVELARNANAFAYDAQYTPDEYGAGKQGWGHSTFVEGVKIAQAANVEKLVLYSHDPAHGDDAIDRIEALAKEQFPNTVAAADGMELTL